MDSPYYVNSGVNTTMTDLLSVKQLKTSFATREGEVQSVRGVSFTLKEGEVVGLVGESGSGKSVTARSLIRLIQPPGRITDGQILFRGEDLLTKSDNELRKIRGNRISMIFQDPMTSLNPVVRVGKQMTEVIRRHRKMDKSAARKEAIELLRQVGIPSPEERIDQYPHEFSGGMRQRVMIAMALSCKPELLIADEPTTALDVTIQAQILQLMQELKDSTQTSILMITHDLGVVAQVCTRVIVMYGDSLWKRDQWSVFSLTRSIRILRDYCAPFRSTAPKVNASGWQPLKVHRPICFIHQRDVRLWNVAHMPWKYANRCLRIPRRHPVIEHYAGCWTIKVGNNIKYKQEQRQGRWTNEYRNRSARSAAGRAWPEKYFPVRGAGKGKDVVKAVDNVSFHIHKGETFGLVGESGCGKSTTGRSIVRLYDVTDGSIMFGGQDVAKMNERQLKPFRKRMQTIFQDPYSSLNPGMNVLQIISEPMEIHNYASKAEMKGRALDLMNRVGLKPEHAERYPHEFSGGSVSGSVLPVHCR